MKGSLKGGHGEMSLGNSLRRQINLIRKNRLKQELAGDDRLAAR